jgi:hypothetical protein
MGGLTHNGTGFKPNEYQFTDVSYLASYSGSSAQIVTTANLHYYGAEKPHIVRVCVHTTVVSKFDPNDIVKPHHIETSRMPDQSSAYLVRLVTKNNRTLIREEETVVQIPNSGSPLEGRTHRRDVHQLLLQFGSNDAAQRCIEILNSVLL